jgi:uncharacterized protein YaaQ
VTEAQIDRVALVIVYQWQAKLLLEALQNSGFNTTVVHATSGLLREGLVTLLVGTPKRRLPTLFCLVRDACPGSTRFIPHDADIGFPWQPECEVVVVRTGGATAFVMPVDQFVQL